MNKNERNLIINIIFVILSSILSYYYFALPYLKECKDIKIPKNATCHHDMFCISQYCNYDADTCPLPCNSTKRWIVVSIIIIFLSNCCVYLLILVIYYILNKLCKLFFKYKNNNKNTEYVNLY